MGIRILLCFDKSLYPFLLSIETVVVGNIKINLFLIYHGFKKVKPYPLVNCSDCVPALIAVHILNIGV